MRGALRQVDQVAPGYRPCAACEEPKDRNAQYCFVAGVAVICTSCYLLGFRFDAEGGVVREREV